MPRLPHASGPTRKVSFRLPAELVDFLDESAAKDSRDRTKQLVHLLRECARERGYALEARDRAGPQTTKGPAEPPPER